MIGTLINIVTVLVGGSLGTVLGNRLSERIRGTVLHGIGLVTLTMGVHLTLKTHNLLIVMGSVLLGTIMGEALSIDVGLERLGEWLRVKVARQRDEGEGNRFVEGFVTASLVFCVGPVTILGAIQDGLTGDYSLLALKSVLDGFSALAFSASLGVGVLFSVLTLVVYQGGLSLLAGLAEAILSEAMMAEMTAAGGVIILGLGLVLLDLKKVRIANFLPALIIAPAIVALLTALGIAI